jgi:hypothetical protein
LVGLQHVGFVSNDFPECSKGSDCDSHRHYSITRQLAFLLSPKRVGSRRSRRSATRLRELLSLRSCRTGAGRSPGAWSANYKRRMSSKLAAHRCRTSRSLLDSGRRGTVCRACGVSLAPRCARLLPESEVAE